MAAPSPRRQQDFSRPKGGWGTILRSPLLPLSAPSKEQGETGSARLAQTDP